MPFNGNALPTSILKADTSLHELFHKGSGSACLLMYNAGVVPARKACPVLKWLLQSVGPLRLCK